MTFTPTDLQAISQQTDSLKEITERILSSSSKSEAKTHEDACVEMSLQLSSVLNYYDVLIEQKRRDLADTRNERRKYEQWKREIAEHGRRAKNHFFELLRNEPI